MAEETHNNSSSIGKLGASLAPMVALLESQLTPLTFVVLFGSLANRSDTENSDIDIAVLTDGNIEAIERWTLENHLAELAGRDVDLVDLRTASTVLKMQIITHGLLLAGDRDQFNAYAASTMTMYQHLQQERKEILDDFRKEHFCG